MSEIYKGYANGLTDKIGEKSGQNGLAIKQTFYMIDVNEENFGEVADVLNYSAGYWMSSRVINCDNDDKGGRFSISCVNNSKVDAVTLVCSGMDNAQGLWRFSIRPVITLYSDIEIENSIGINNADNPHSIVKY